MKTLDLAPPAKWLKFDDDLSVEVRRCSMRELMDLVEGTRLGGLLYGAGADGETERRATTPWREMVELGERVIEHMVTDWTVADPEGGKIPVSLDAGRWLMTEVPGLTLWLVDSVLMPAFGVEIEVEQEKKD